MILRDWNEMSNSLQADDRRRTTGSCFSELDHVIVSNFSLLMAHQK